MSDSGISTLILVTASLLVSVVVAGLLVELSDVFSSDLTTIGGIVSSQIRFELSIISNPEFVEDNGDVTIHVQNTGAEPINLGVLEDGEATRLNVFINGELQDPSNVTLDVPDRSNPWRPSEVIIIEFNSADITLQQGNENTIDVVVNDNRDSIDFFVPA